MITVAFCAPLPHTCVVVMLSYMYCILVATTCTVLYCTEETRLPNSQPFSIHCGSTRDKFVHCGLPCHAPVQRVLEERVAYQQVTAGMQGVSMDNHAPVVDVAAVGAPMGAPADEPDARVSCFNGNPILEEELSCKLMRALLRTLLLHCSQGQQGGV